MIEQVERLKPELESSFTPYRELAEDRRVHIDIVRGTQRVSTSGTEGKIRWSLVSRGIESKALGNILVRITYEIGMFISRPSNVPSVRDVAADGGGEGKAGPGCEEIVELPIPQDIVRQAVARGPALSLADWNLEDRVFRQDVGEIRTSH